MTHEIKNAIPNHESDNLFNIDDEQLDKLLTQTYRQHCPDPMTLINYDMGLLDEPEQQQLTDHINSCDFCQVALTDMHQFLEIDDVPWATAEGFEWRQVFDQLIDRAKLEVRFLKTAFLPSQLAPALRGKHTPPLAEINLDPDQTNDWLNLTATIYPDKQTKTQCQLIVTVEIPERGFDWSGITVRVTAMDWRDQKETDSDGQVVWEKAPLDKVTHLEIEVDPG